MNLQDSYSRREFLTYLKSYIPGFEKDIRKTDSDHLKVTQEAFYLGESPDLNLAVFEIKHTSSVDARIALATDGFRLMKDSANYQALIAYHPVEGEDWRLSLMTATPDVTEKSKVTLKLSNPRRYSYFLGKNAKVHTPYRFLIKQGAVKDFEDLKNRFSLEVVNKEFYKQISESFTKLVGGTIGLGKNQGKYEPLLRLPSVNSHSPECMQFGVRLIGRIIFCWFLREKKSSTGLPLMPKELLSLDAVADNPDYYHGVLEPIFFEVLNKESKSRREQYSRKPFSLIPYLNGGLFSPHADDYYKCGEHGQSLFHNTLVVPDSWFQGLFEILETYNFTIDENTSFDEELSIDPEMLGRIFENLLAEINPETGESARKSTGSYYTPRVIVDYMVDESLLLYLKGQTEIEEDKLRTLISYDLRYDIDRSLTEVEKQKIVDSLEVVKILDPACGSGAFPIGALQKIVFVLQEIDPDGQLWFQKQLHRTPPELRRMLEREHRFHNFDYIRKLGIIRENIYGVDIQPIATEISRLRCFLTLMVEQYVKDKEDNRGIEPLPNLDFKFVTANSLIGLPSIGTQAQTEMFDDRQKIDELKYLRDQYFNASGIEREQLKTEFILAQKRLIEQLIKEHDFIGAAKAELTQKLTEWEPFSYNSSGWFDPEWMFGIKDGFHIVIANPPYVRHEGIKQIKPTLQKYFECYKGTSDLYIYFFEKGVSLLRKEGILTFISSNKYFRSAYGEKLRAFLRNKMSIQKIIDFGDTPVFNAISYPSILIAHKTSPNANHFEALTWKLDEPLERFHEILATKNFIMSQSDLAKGGWRLTDQSVLNLLEKLRNSGERLSDYVNGRIYRGIVTGFNEAFIVDKETRDKIIADHPLSSELLKPFVRGRDVKRWHVNFQDLWIIFTRRGIDIMKYQSILRHLEKYRDRLTPGIKGGRKPGSYEWFEIQDNTAYWQEFENTLIVWGNLTTKPNFAFTKPGMYLSAPANLIASESKYLIGILNSKVTEFLISQSGAERQGGFLEYKPMYVSPIPIPHQPKEENISLIVDRILTAKHLKPQMDISEWEEEIDHMVYQLYGLTENEIAIVEETT